MSDTAPIPRLGLSRQEAAASLGVSVDTFERHIQPSLRMVRIGRVRLVPIAELNRWLDSHAEHTINNRRTAA